MKNFFPSIIPALIFFSFSAFSQTVTLEISGGYSVPLARSYEAIERYGSQDSIFPFYYTTEVKLKPRSFGQGGCIGLNFNWFSKKNIGLGIKVNTLFGTSFKHASMVYTTTYTYNEFYDYTSKSFSFQFIPHLSFRHDFKVVSPMLEAGLILGITQLKHRSIITANYNSQTIETNVREGGGAMIGFYSSLGLLFNVSRIVKINVALNCMAASYSPSKWKRTSFTVDGTDRLAALSRSQREGQYVTELVLTAPQNPSEPSFDLKYAVTMSNIGFTAGICFQFGKGNAKKLSKKVPQENPQF
ncbi:MAG: hypothetical protein V4615_03935 [Bacteroidota bacterium]